MRRADDLGSEARRTLGEPGPGATDEAFLAALAAGRSRHLLRRRLVGLGVLAAILLVATMLTTGGDEPDPIEPPPDPVVAKREPPPLVNDPAAALLLESARLRLEGFGDPQAVPETLRGVMTRYPRSVAAMEAAAILRDLEGRPR